MTLPPLLSRPWDGLRASARPRVSSASEEQIVGQNWAAPPPATALSFSQAVMYALGAVLTFHLAYISNTLCFLIGVYLFCLYSLARLATARQAYYTGLAIGLSIYGPQLGFFYTIFGLGAVALWYVLAFWIALFVLLARQCRLHFGPLGLALCAPFLWTGLEYFRSELYYLRFSWLNVGYAFSDSPQLDHLMPLGVYGVGFVLMSAVAIVSTLSRKDDVLLRLGHKLRLYTVYRGALPTLTGLFMLFALGLFSQWPTAPKPSQGAPSMPLPLAGAQIEFASTPEILQLLDQLLQWHPQAQLLVLSEYTFDGPVPKPILNWCRKARRYLAVGGKDLLSHDQFHNTIFVIDPQGEIVFRQVKCVPIQFFKDGLPAQEQKLWHSPWGRLGFCVCYDLSYRRVVDQLIRLGAQAIIVPTMDAMHWGAYQHQLHSRVAPVRAAEYGVPIFRLASSGISQIVDRTGQVTASAPYPGQQALIGGTLDLSQSGSVPLDQWLAPFSVAMVVLTLMGFPLRHFTHPPSAQSTPPKSKPKIFEFNHG